MATHPTFGVEEEFLLVDPDSGEPVPRNRAVAERAKAQGVDLQLELARCQVETTSDVMASSEELRGELSRLRARRIGGGRRGRRATPGRRVAPDGPARVSDHRHAALSRDRREVRHDRPRAGHMWLPRARRRALAGGGGSGEQPVAALAAVAARADGELGDLPQRRHRIRQLAQRALGAVAQRGPAAALRFGRRLRRAGRDDAGRRRHDGRRHGLLGRPTVGQLSDHRGARRRRRSHGRRDGSAGHAGEGDGDDGTRRRANPITGAAPDVTSAQGGVLEGGAGRFGRPAHRPGGHPRTAARCATALQPGRSSRAGTQGAWRRRHGPRRTDAHRRRGQRCHASATGLGTAPRGRRRHRGGSRGHPGRGGLRPAAVRRTPEWSAASTRCRAPR